MPDSVLGAAAASQWHTDGWCVLEDVFTHEEIAAAQLALVDLFPSAEAVQPPGPRVPTA